MVKPLRVLRSYRYGRGGTGGRRYSILTGLFFKTRFWVVAEPLTSLPCDPSLPAQSPQGSLQILYLNLHCSQAQSPHGSEGTTKTYY